MVSEDTNGFIENQTVLDVDFIMGAESLFLVPHQCNKSASLPLSKNSCSYEINAPTSDRFRSTLRSILDNQAIRDHLHSNGVEASFNSLAIVLTNHIRTNKEICQGFASGIAYSWQLVILGKMSLFIPLGIYMGLSTTFLLGVIWCGRYYHVWKSSPFPLLFASLNHGCTSDSNYDSPLRPGLRMEDMEKAAKRMTVHMDDSDGIKFTPYVEEKETN